MPSSLIVKCVPIKEVRPHPNADKLVIVKLMGWQVCELKKDNPKVGDLRVFIPPDTILPDKLAKELGVENYLKPGNRVGQIRLRGEPSFGISVPNKWKFKINEEVSEQLGITKWYPPENLISGDMEVANPFFVNYTDIENFRNFPDVFEPGEKVVVTEKIHGTNQKTGLIYDLDTNAHIFMVGSHETRKRLGQGSLYEKPLEGLKDILTAVSVRRAAKSVIIYTEVFGRIQKNFEYGCTKGVDWIAYDIYVDGHFMNYDEAQLWFDEYDIPSVPMLFKGPFSEEKMWELSSGNTTLIEENPHIREGVVVKPVHERTDPDLGRVILKFLNNDFLLKQKRKKGKQNGSV